MRFAYATSRTHLELKKLGSAQNLVIKSGLYSFQVLLIWTPSSAKLAAVKFGLLISIFYQRIIAFTRYGANELIKHPQSDISRHCLKIVEFLPFLVSNLLPTIWCNYRVQQRCHMTFQCFRSLVPFTCKLYLANAIFSTYYI